MEGRTFGELLPAMQESLRDIIPRVRVDPKPKVLVLAKGETVELQAKGAVCNE